MRNIGARCIGAGLLLTCVGTAAAEGSPIRGEAVYKAICSACHALDANKTGPMHRGVIGRRAGSLPGFDYSPALRSSSVVWEASTIDRWLTDPERFIPGQKMGYSLRDAQRRADVISYLKQESERPPDASAIAIGGSEKTN